MSKVGGWLRRVFSLEPVAVQAVVRAVLVLAGILGIAVPNGFEERSLAAVAALWGLAELVGNLWARIKSTPNVKVVEAATRDGDVVAGPANDVVPTGVIVRQLDAQPRAPGDVGDDL